LKTGNESAERRREGFSLIELLVVLTIIMTMTGITVMGMGSYRGKMTEQQVRAVSDELLLAQSAQQTRPGTFRIQLRQDSHVWEVVVERTMDQEITTGTAWSEYDRRELASSNTLRISDEKGTLLKKGYDGSYYQWSFDRASGACTEGAGTLVFSGSGKAFTLTVYEPTGRSEVHTDYGVR
jgi:prepilin-type N-terminal cleavage/methylation domain-containing protein